MKKRMRTAALLCGAVTAAAAFSAPAAAAYFDVLEFSAPAAAASSDIPEAVYEKLPLMYDRIAGFDDTAVEDCIIKAVHHNLNYIATVITPNNFYAIQALRTSCYRVTTKDGKAPDAEKITADWKTMLLENGLPADHIDWQTFEATVTPDEDAFLVELTSGQPGWKQFSYLDVLEADPNITQITTTFSLNLCKHQLSLLHIFILPHTEQTWSAADFPELNIESFTESSDGYTVKLADAAFTDYYNALKLYKNRDDIDFTLCGAYQVIEVLGSEGNLQLDEPTTVFYRGDMNIDDDLNVVDAVLLARLVGEDGSAPIPEDGYRNADANGDGLLTVCDVTAVLKTIAQIE